MSANEAFTWAGGGEKTSISGRRRLAEALMAQGMDASPIKSPWQGINRVAQALLGGYQVGEIDREEKAEKNAATQLLLSHPALGGTPTIGATPGAQPIITPATPMPNTTGKIYANDEPSPLDPPDGAAKDMAVRTVIAEAGNQPFDGQVGVASTFRNRAVDGGFGGDTLPGVIQKPFAYEPHNTPAGRARMAAIDPNSPQYQMASKAVDAAYFGNDPSEGATHFYSPKAQAALGRPAPAWANGDSTTIGDHVFYSPDDAQLPANARYTQGAPPAAAQPGPAVAQTSQMTPDVANYVRALIANPSTRAAGVQMLQQYSKPRETYSQVTDDAGNIWSVNNATGQRTIALKKDKEEAAPTSIREYQYYKANLPLGQEPMDYGTWSTAKARAGASTTNVTTDISGGSAKQIFDEFNERSKAARTTAQGLTAIRNAREAIDNGAITGFRADDRLSLQKAAKWFGVPLADANKIEGSEVFKAAIAPQVAAVLRGTVGSANISDSDRRFAERAAGGSLDLDEASIRRLLDIMERASTNLLQEHQEQLDAVYPDPVAHKRERALFGVKVAPGGKPAGTTATGRTWSLEN